MQALLKICLVVAALVGLVLALVFLPINELLSVAEFKLTPNRAKQSHFVKLKKSDQTIYVLGTTHESQFESDGYAILQIVSPKEVLFDEEK